jgi:hypothetical protein
MKQEQQRRHLSIKNLSPCPALGCLLSPAADMPPRESIPLSVVISENAWADSARAVGTIPIREEGNLQFEVTGGSEPVQETGIALSLSRP